MKRLLFLVSFLILYLTANAFGAPVTSMPDIGTPAGSDVLPIIDVSEIPANQNKKVTVTELLSGATGTIDTTGTVNADEIAVFYDSDTLKALTVGEFKVLADLVSGTDILGLSGVAGGQTIYGGTNAGNDFSLYSTSNATKGNISLDNFFITDVTNFTATLSSATSPILDLIDTTNNADAIITTDNSGSLVFKADSNNEAALTYQQWYTDGTLRMHLSDITFYLDGPSLKIKEASAAETDTSDYGQLWVKDDSPNVLMFTDDAGSDYEVVLNGGGGGAGDLTLNANLVSTNATFQVYPDADATDTLEIGVWDGNRYSSIGLVASNGSAIEGYADSDNYVNVGAYSSTGILSLDIKDTGYLTGISFENNGSSLGYLYPDTGTVDLGTASKPWNDLVISNDGYIGSQSDLNAMQLTSAGNLILTQSLLLNETTNPDVTIGLTINNGDNDDSAFVLKNSDVYHVMTDEYEYDTYFAIDKSSSILGGALLTGLSDGNGAGLKLRGYIGTNTPSAGAIEIDGAKYDDGTSVEAIGDSQPILAVRNNGTAKLYIYGNGDYVSPADMSIADIHLGGDMIISNGGVLKPSTTTDDNYYTLSAYGDGSLLADAIKIKNDTSSGASNPEIILSGTITAPPVKAYPPIVSADIDNDIHSYDWYGGTIVASGADTFNLVAVQDGMNFCVLVPTAVTLTIDPNGTEEIFLNGVTEGAGVSVDNGGTANSRICFQYLAAGDWLAIDDGNW